jgi:hypothetical protein
MNKTLIRAVRIIDEASPYDGQVKDVLIENGIVTNIGNSLTAPDAKVLDYANACISTGWVDMRVSAQDPGFEHKENLQTLCKAAAAGGFTEIAVLPNTQPVTDSKDTIGYIKQATQHELVVVHAIGAATKKCEGKDFTEMIDLVRAGAVGFSDGHYPIESAHILLKSLQYLQPQNRVLINRPADAHLSVFGQMNEGITSTMLGMRGIPNLAEELMIQRDLKLLEYLDRKQTAALQTEFEAILKTKKLKASDAEAKALLKDFQIKNPILFADVETVANHIDHVIKLTGSSLHVGIGSDFDGVGDSLPTGLKDVSQYPNLVYALLKRGHKESDIANILYRNVWRVWANVTK